MQRPYLIIPILLALTITVTLTLINGLSLGVDINFHLKIAEAWSNGKLGMFSQTVMQENNFPYPPLFHFLLAPAFWINQSVSWALLLQVAFLPLAVASFMYLCVKVFDNQTAFIGGFLVLGSLAYLDRTLQPQPQALDFVLLPLAFSFFLTAKSRLSYILSSVVLIFNHGIINLATLGGSLLLKVKAHDYKTILSIFWGSSIILVISALYIFGGLTNFGGNMDTEQIKQFWSNPFFIPSYLMLLTFGFGVAAYRIFQYIRKIDISRVSVLCLLSLWSLLILVPFMPDRLLQYSTIPLALLLLEWLRNLKPQLRIIGFSVVGMVAVFMFDILLFI